jgi:HD superfamily phosphodiesterase
MPRFREALVAAMEAYFGDDAPRIAHAHRVTGFAEELLRREGGDYSVVIAAAVLHDIGIPEAERKLGSAAGHYQEREGPPVARKILDRLEAAPALIQEVCEIISHHHTPGKVRTHSFGILNDADWLVNLRDEYTIDDPAKLRNVIDRVFLTKSGRELAAENFLPDEAAA